MATYGIGPRLKFGCDIACGRVSVCPQLFNPLAASKTRILHKYLGRCIIAAVAH